MQQYYYFFTVCYHDIYLVEVLAIYKFMITLCTQVFYDCIKVDDTPNGRSPLKDCFSPLCVMI